MKNKAVSGIMLTLLLVVMLDFPFNIQPVKAEPKTWTVDDDGPADFSSIREAINSLLVVDGDTIFVYSGTYYENVVVDKTVTLIGENEAVTVIDGNGDGIVVSLIERANVSGFTIRNGDYGIMVRTYNMSPVYTGHTIGGNIIADNYYGGICLRGVGGNIITNNFITNNSLFGIHLYHAGNNTLSNNNLTNNGHGIDFYGNSNDNVLRNNNMKNNKYNFGLILRGETRNWLFGTPSRPGIVNDVDTSNTADGKPIYYWVNRSDEHIPSDAGYVWLNNCTNITIDGSSLSNNLQGILLLFTRNALIKNNNIISNVYGIYVGLYSSNNTIVGNALKDNLNGIYLGDLSRFTTMRNNIITGGQMNFGVPPDIPLFMDRSDLINDIDASNSVDGKPIIYWINQHDRQVPTNAGYVMLINSTNILIKGLNLSNNVQNIFLLTTNKVVIANNSITNSIYGIDVKGVTYFPWWPDPTMIYLFSFNTTVSGNILADNSVGVRFRSNNSTISNNTVLRSPLGIGLQDTSNSIISRNVVVGSDVKTTYPPDIYIFYYPEEPWERSRELIALAIGGIIVGGVNNFVYENTVMNNSFVGISMNDQLRRFFGTGNRIFHNNFINNTRFQALESFRERNWWDDGYPSGGNYWSDYTGVDVYSGLYQNESGSDGIGDTPYVVYSGMEPPNRDRYPLMKPWAPTQPIPPVVTATIDIDPDTLNLKSKGRWITAYIQLPEGYNPEDIDATTILLNETISAVLDPKYDFVTNPSEYLVDHDEDGVLERMVKFDRAMVQSFIYNQGIRYDNVPLTMAGELFDGTPFEGTDVIFVNYAGDANNDGIVNILDAAMVSAHWYPGPPIGTLGYDSYPDFNDDGAVNILDAGILSVNWGQTTHHR